MSTTHDPFDAATEAGERSGVWYGKCDVGAAFVKLVKGQGKSLWSEQDGIDQRRTEVHIVITPIDAMNSTQLLERKIIAESKDWSGTVWPSLRTLGLRNARDLHGKWAKVEFVKTGRTYTTRNGQTGEETTLKFVELFDTAAACTGAYVADGGRITPKEPAMEIDMSQAPLMPNGNHEKETASLFLPILVKQAAGDIKKLSEALAGTPLVNKHFTIASPEVVTLLRGAA